MHRPQDPNDVYLDTNLKHLRLLAGRTQAEMASALELKRSSYSGYEVGSAEPQASVLCRMALHHHITLDMLLMRDLRKLTRFALQAEQRRNAQAGCTAPVATPAQAEPAASKPTVSKRLIHERHPREMNRKLKVKAEGDGMPRVKKLPTEKGTVVLRLDAKTTVRVKPGYALDQWLEKYPGALLVP